MDRMDFISIVLWIKVSMDLTPSLVGRTCLMGTKRVLGYRYSEQANYQD
jgi:hypothetical protein